MILRHFADGPAAFTDDVVYTSSTTMDGYISSIHAYKLNTWDHGGCRHVQLHTELRPPFGVVLDYAPFEDKSAVVVLWGMNIRYVL